MGPIRYSNSGWQTPDRNKIQKEILRKDRDGKWAYRGSATSVLDVYGIWREFIRRSIRPLREGSVDAQLLSYECLCSVIDGLLLAKGTKAPSDLAQRIKKHLDAYAAAYGEERLVPKHHWALHLSRQIVDDDGELYDCWVDERTNKGIKRYARNIENWSAFSKSVASRALNDFLRSLDTFEPTRQESQTTEDERLTVCIGNVFAVSGVPIEVAGVEASRRMVVENIYHCAIHLQKGDFIFGAGEDDAAGIVVACLTIRPSMQAYILINKCELLEQLSPHSSLWRDTCGSHVLAGKCVVANCIYKSRNNVHNVLRPV